MTLVASTACGESCGRDNNPLADANGGGGDAVADAGDIGDGYTYDPPDDAGDTTNMDADDASADATDTTDATGGDVTCADDCSPGDNRCTEDGKSQTCVPGPGGCGRWGQASACGSDEFCHDDSGLCQAKSEYPCRFQDKCSANANCVKDSEAADGFVCNCHGNYVDYKGDGSICIPEYFTTIDPGTFQMGSPSGETGRDSDETKHQVEISHPLAIQKYEVTQATWGEFEKNSQPWAGATKCTQTVCPVYNVSWWDALHFANTMSEDHDLEKCYELQGCSGTPGSDNFSCSGVNFKGVDCNGWRLPTEAEWEYAARAGTSTATYNGDLSDATTDETVDAIAWYQGNSNDKPHVWGSKQENSWKLNEMSGNVAEWVWDWHGSYASGSQTDPTGASSGSERVVRGGHWDSPAKACRSAARDKASPGTRNNKIGFRVVRTLPEK